MSSIISIKMHYTMTLTLAFIFVSCKKDYTCECKTIDPHQGFVNAETYHVREKSKEDAMVNCAKQYDQSGKATNGISCVVN
ncbi:MAG: hypothetical protein KBG47_04190 [Bacteroidia bacterium]|nr:hypothetical protein [Sphingobacteriaceae bacterium]MBP9068682.1 hypothetical protein [Bacteroidia bacterium]